MGIYSWRALQADVAVRCWVILIIPGILFLPRPFVARPHPPHPHPFFPPLLMGLVPGAALSPAFREAPGRPGRASRGRGYTVCSPRRELSGSARDGFSPQFSSVRLSNRARRPRSRGERHPRSPARENGRRALWIQAATSLYLHPIPPRARALGFQAESPPLPSLCTIALPGFPKLGGEGEKKDPRPRISAHRPFIGKGLPRREPPGCAACGCGSHRGARVPAAAAFLSPSPTPSARAGPFRGLAGKRTEGRDRSNPDYKSRLIGLAVVIPARGRGSERAEQPE